ncbi:MAG TPA: hypothetical protein VGA37_06435 [Gemmatimonadales bacterium]
MCTLVAGLPRSATGQHREGGEDIILSAGGDPDTPDYNVSAARRARGFRLFAVMDGAGTGMRGTGDFSWATDNYGPCDAPLSGFCAYNVHPRRNPTLPTFQHFEILTTAGTPPSEWRKIRAVAPSAGNALGNGWTSLHNFALFSGRLEWGPADGSLGTLFSGVVSTSDGSCRDHTGFANGFYPIGLPLLAGSDCPETWAAGGFGGDRPIPVDAWLARFAELGPGFRFDYWQVPDRAKVDGRLGDRFATYGAISDHYADILDDYGAVIPGGEGAPRIPGYPLGLVWHFDAFNFTVPGLEDVHFWRATVVNRSADVYGAGVSYDSLYLGFQVGLGAGDGGGGDHKSSYFRADLGAAVYHQSRVRIPGPCDDPARGAGGGIVGCTSSSSAAGYGNGATATLVLKSPIGDLRNKLLSDPTSAFFSLGHPAAGDTITFNHGHMCGFGGCWASTHNVNDKRSFGMLSSTAANVLDGRDPELTGTLAGWRTFRTFGWPAVIGEFNHYAPGVDDGAALWDYDHDGRADTLWFDSCHVFGCVTTDWDTMPGGQWNAYANIGGILAAGPFPLVAGDSTSWFVAFIGSRDSVPLWHALAAATDAYLNFFPQPTNAPAPRIVATQTAVTNEAGAPAAPSVTLRFDAAAESWEDAYLEYQAMQIEAAADGAAAGELLALNPWLPGALRAHAAANVEALEVYKSCDGGRTYTADADCDGDPTVGVHGEALGTGWRPYAVYAVDTVGPDLPNAFVDESVLAGRSYTYVLVTKTRGVTLPVVTSTGTVDREFAPVMRSPLDADPTRAEVATVYVPVSREAGGHAAFATVRERPATVTVPFAVQVTDLVVPGTYHVVFGNRLVVERDSVADGAVQGTRVVVQQVVATANDPAYVLRSETFTHAGPAAIPVNGTPTSAVTSLVSGVVRTTTTYAQLGFVVADATGDPVFASVNLTGIGATPDRLIGSPRDPGFWIEADQGLAGTYDAQAEAQLRGAAARAGSGTPADTVPRMTADAFMVQFREQDAEPTAAVGGRYRVTWADDAFGLPGGIVLNFTNPAATEREFHAALTGRAAADTARTDPETAALTGVRQSDLVAARLPFTIRNVTFDRAVHVAMERRAFPRLVLGVGDDTVSVRVPEDVWVPGDVLRFLEPITEDSVDVAGNVVLVGGQPAPWTHRVATYEAAVVGCNTPAAPFCNPTAAGTRGQSGYRPTAAGDRTEWAYYVGFDPASRYVIDVTGPVTGADITAVDAAALDAIRVVPNPFLLASRYQDRLDDPRIVFTNMPPQGLLRLYTVSGQLAQQITWTPADLLGAGDLHVRLVAQSGNVLASGLYLWVLTAPSRPGEAGSTPLVARGKFVIVQGGVR